MAEYYEVILCNKKTRIPYKTHNIAIWLDLKRTLIAIGYASYTTHQEQSLRDSGTHLRFYGKRPYADARALKFLHDNIAMPSKKRERLKEIIAALETEEKKALESTLGFSLEEGEPVAIEPTEEGNNLTRVYVAGRMSCLEYRPKEYGHFPEGRSLLGVELSKSNGKDEGACYKEGSAEKFYFGTKKYLYVGPFFLGDNHGCLNDSAYHLIDRYAAEYGEDVSRHDVVEVCTKQIASADFVFAWLGSDSHEAHGTLTEIGYAKGLGIPVYTACTAQDTFETWFAKHLADNHFVCEDFLSAFRIALTQYEENMSERYS